MKTVTGVPQKRATLGNPKDSIWDAIFGETKVGGVTVNTSTALTLSAVYSALNILCNSLNIPVNVYRRSANGNREKVSKYQQMPFQIDQLLHVQPNRYMTPTTWFQVMETSRNLYGNGYSIIHRNGGAVPIELEWVHPDYVGIYSDGTRYVYRVYDSMGRMVYDNLLPEDMIHVKALSLDGIIGKPPIEVARESLGFGMATQQAGNKLYENGIRSSGVLSLPGVVDRAKFDKVTSQFDKQYAGTSKTGKTIVLEEGAKFQPLTINPVDAQFLQSREFSVTEVARWFNIPEHLLNNNTRSTFNNIEHQALEFITYNVRPRARMYEQEFNWKLLGNSEQFYVEFNLNALLRADAQSRALYYVQMVQNGLMNRDEIRALENLNRIPDNQGEEFMTPLNLAFDSEREQKINTTQDGQGNQDDTE